jgi:hypothetical protein
MRSYIFTERERRIIQGFLSGTVKGKDPGLMVIVSRLKSFSNLAKDVELYIRLREAISAAST